MSWTRRRFLQALGTAAVASPFLPLLNATGQSTSVPKRIILFFTPHATYWPNWTPTGTTNNFVLGPILQPLAAHQSKLNVLTGVGMLPSTYFAAHTPGGEQLWTGADLARGAQNPDGSYQYGINTGASIDQIIAARVGAATPYRSLQFGAWGYETVIFSAPGAAVYPELSATDAFSRLFTQLPAKTVDAQASVLDVISQQLAALQPRLGAADLAKLDAHLTSVRAAEVRLQSIDSACVAPMLTPSAQDPTSIAAMMDIIAAALTCDLTRVVSLQFGQQDNDGNPYPFLNIQAGHHALTHLPPSDTVDDSGNAVSDSTRSVNGQLTTIYTWYAQQFAALLDRLDAVPESNGTLLDNTLVIWGSELGNYYTHAFQPSIPFVLAGGGAAGMQTGRFLDFTAQPQIHNRLLVSACNFMGLSDITTVGNMDTGHGPLLGL